MNGLWKLSLVGGVISIVLTVGVFVLSGVGNEVSLNMVFVGGFVAGILARNREHHIGRVGLRTGVIGGLLGVWILMDLFLAVAAVASPPVFRVVSVVFVLGMMTIVVLGVSGVVGVIGAKIGGWVGARLDRMGPIAVTD